MIDSFSKMIQLMRDLVQWEHRTIISLMHGDDAKLVLGQHDVRASVALWRKCIDITDLLTILQTGAAGQGVAAGDDGGGGKASSSSEINGDKSAEFRLKTVGEFMKVITRSSPVLLYAWS
jgi:hypothetical protein